MRRYILLGLAFMLLATTQAHAWIDIFGKNKTKKLTFANQVISEVLTPEEFNQKNRVEELIQADGDHISISDILVGSSPHYEEELGYDLGLKYYETNHKELLNVCKRSSVEHLKYDFKKRHIDMGGYKYEVVYEKPRDIIYVAEGYGSDSPNNFGLYFITRESRVGKWRFFVRYACVASRMTPEKKAQWIERLKNIPSVNKWVAENREKGN